MFIPIGDDNSRRNSFPWVVVLLIAANGALWYLQLTHGEQFTYGYSAVPYEISHGKDITQAAILSLDGRRVRIPQAPGPEPIQLTLLTSMFMHGSWGHILGNMLYLWIFGDQIEEMMGKVRFLIFYLLCGFGAAAAQIALAPSSLIPCLGASGAIAGVLGAYLITHPRNSVKVLILRSIAVLPAYIVLGGWILLQILAQSQMKGASTGVAYAAHIGGFVTGIVLLFPLKRRRKK